MQPGHNVQLYMQTYLIYRYQDPDKEGLVREGAALGEILVQLWVRERSLARHVFVQDQREDRQHRVDCGVPGHTIMIRAAVGSLGWSPW